MSSAQSSNPSTAPTSARSLRIFLCYDRDDKSAVQDLYKRLRDNGFEPWLDVENLLGGQKWRVEIRQAMRNADVVLICLSPKSLTKTGFKQREIQYALEVAEEQPLDLVYLIPVRLEECAVPKRLSEWHWINYFEPDGLEQLLRSLRARVNSLPPKLPPTSASPKTTWRAWGDHPAVVAALVILALLSVLIPLFIYLTGKQSLPDLLGSNTSVPTRFTTATPGPLLGSSSSGSAPTPTVEPLRFKPISFFPPPPAAPDQVTIYACTTGLGGVGVTLKVSVNTTADGMDKGEWKVLKELGVPCFNQIDAPTWDTKDLKPGTYLIKAEARGSDDPEWKNSIVVTAPYTVTERTSSNGSP